MRQERDDMIARNKKLDDSIKAILIIAVSTYCINHVCSADRHVAADDHADEHNDTDINEDDDANEVRSLSFASSSSFSASFSATFSALHSKNIAWDTNIIVKSSIQIVDFLKSWMHPRAPDATVFTRAKITFVADAQM